MTTQQPLKVKEFYVYGTYRLARVAVGATTSLDKIQPNEATFFLYDHLGNMHVAFRVDGSNVPLIVNAMDYYSYGKILREYDNGAGDRYLTTGHERDQKTGLDYRGARYYDSDVARFLSLDPLASKYPSLSAYVYVANNPVIMIDEDGKEVNYPKEIAVAMAARGAKNNYTTSVVANPNKAGDYGVVYTKAAGGKMYQGVQFEGKFEGIVGGGLMKNEQSNGFLNKLIETIPKYSLSVSTKSVFAIEKSQDVMPSGMGDKLVITQFTETAKTAGDPNAIVQLVTRTTQSGATSVNLKIGPVQVGGSGFPNLGSSTSLDFFGYKVGAGINFANRQFASTVGHKNNRGGSDGVRVATQVGGGTAIGGLAIALEFATGGAITPALAPLLAP